VFGFRTSSFFGAAFFLVGVVVTVLSFISWE